MIRSRKNGGGLNPDRPGLSGKIMELSPAGITVVDVNGKIIYANLEAERVLGLRKDEITQRTYNDPEWRITDFDGNPFLDDGLPFALVENGRQPVYGVKHAIEWPDGRRALLSVNASPLFADSGEFAGMVAYIEDVTAKVAADGQREAALEKLRTFFEASPIGIATLDRSGLFTGWNPAAERIYGYHEPEVIGRRFPLNPSDAVPGQDNLFTAVLGGETISGLEFEVTRKDGAKVFVSVSAAPMRDSGGSVIGAIAAFSDVTRLRRAESERQESERRYREMLETVKLVAVMLDAGGRITFCNDFLLEITGWKHGEVSGRDWFDVFIPGEERESVRGVFMSCLSCGDIPAHHENHILARGGEKLLVVWNNTVLRDSSGRPCGTASIGVDVTEHRKLEERFRHAQKMEAVGLLAGGIAHDFNNMLTPILGYSEMLLMKMRCGDPGYTEVMQIKQAGERARDLTRQLLAFSRKQVLTMKPVRLSEIVLCFEKMLRRTIREDISIEIKADTPAVVRADAGQIEQILMNLAVNAQDAMPVGGTISIAISEEYVDSAGETESEIGSGRYGVISFTDSGEGMGKEVLDRIFEPFFTTKAPGKGTGLGLATLYGIVKQHGGGVVVESAPGEGTEFRIYLPSAETETEESRPGAGVAPARSGKGTVVVVEDDPMVRRLTCKVLEIQGFEVFCPESAAASLDIAKQTSRTIHLLLTDLVMPGINGAELYGRFREIHPETRVLYMSGYAAGTMEAEAFSTKGAPFIQKPFSVTDLAAQIRAIMDEEKDMD